MKYLYIVLAVILLFGCSSNEFKKNNNMNQHKEINSNENIENEPKEIKKDYLSKDALGNIVSKRINEFGLKLFKKICDDKMKRSFVIYPDEIFEGICFFLNGINYAERRKILDYLEFNNLNILDLNYYFGIKDKNKFLITKSLFYKSEFNINSNSQIKENYSDIEIKRYNPLEPATRFLDNFNGDMIYYNKIKTSYKYYYNFREGGIYHGEYELIEFLDFYVISLPLEEENRIKFIVPKNKLELYKVVQNYSMLQDSILLLNATKENKSKLERLKFISRTKYYGNVKIPEISINSLLKLKNEISSLGINIFKSDGNSYEKKYILSDLVQLGEIEIKKTKLDTTTEEFIDVIEKERIKKAKEKEIMKKVLETGETIEQEPENKYARIEFSLGHVTPEQIRDFNIDNEFIFYVENNNRINCLGLVTE